MAKPKFQNTDVAKGDVIEFKLGGGVFAKATVIETPTDNIGPIPVRYGTGCVGVVWNWDVTQILTKGE